MQLVSLPIKYFFMIHPFILGYYSNCLVISVNFNVEKIDGNSAVFIFQILSIVIWFFYILDKYHTIKESEIKIEIRNPFTKQDKVNKLSDDAYLKAQTIQHLLDRAASLTGEGDMEGADYLYDKIDDILNGESIQDSKLLL